ncbi:UDP-N-acetylmuramoyl-L-alanine--D-glutamate ligase [Clostridium kluyveri]|uniref:UDP-N-acetylmuramoylalanine--D-glutamate ligase n=2 Tax=Clostridium kluyveri TaxID=1534 RepID=MURD_CLOK5|nr:UDP-N-acetylmuramoyl-L-alanine--D-glutamate ligase [Clostridium kluyveri]A5N4L3.1 RecName: Full=UDP-N-acetylmuramoylalanine--D-glutamate ligase; AltName: Full=D-glutamic acid-adding enzyme; AltName: Full=UDP-N-acetylmuramoyl-L-alanyl-D-glutamate synthetase [Clostridium kluyveri DSM 555]B9DY75.1 RecName: Full=UDP-N-acetylmuramoylalanine--D-glutamate ligase; AltName: Full=D-glutamic acid-adding enzyme; AltName: Full=UDP-N-acetylmuramoyl-L-alanyl-D-glutamate synthetase [Clostridium kluyveri NBRC 
MKRNFDDFKQFIKCKKIGVVGIGISNKPLIDFLLKLGARVSAFDKKSPDEIGEVARELKEKNVDLVLGEKYLNDLSDFDIIFKTPSMRIDSPAFVKAKEKGAYITSEMEEFIRYCPAKIYGVTGSDGKTTTTTLMYNILKKQGYKSWIGGNIGTPLFSEVEEITPDDRVVIELSSFQLMTMNISPEVAVITNVSPNHLDIHKDMEEYIMAKKNIFKYQSNSDLLVLNKDNELTNSMTGEALGKVRQFSIKEKLNKGGYLNKDSLCIDGDEVCKLSEIKLKGMHNVENLLAAFCALKDDVNIESMREIATTFSGVEHRCEFVREINGVKYYNDSIASSPTRTLAGLKAFEKPVILIAGGYDKKIPFDILAEEGYSKIKTLVLMGATKYKIKEAFENLELKKHVHIPIIMANSLVEAVNSARKVSCRGDVVTLSPACASFDMFANFEIRGNMFKEIVNDM